MGDDVCVTALGTEPGLCDSDPSVTGESSALQPLAPPSLLPPIGYLSVREKTPSKKSQIPSWQRMLELNVPPRLVPGSNPTALQRRARAQTQALAHTQPSEVQLQVSEPRRLLQETTLRSDSRPPHP